MATCTHTYQYVIRFYVGMENATPLHELEGQEQLLSVRPHSLDVETNVLTVLLQHFSKIHAMYMYMYM